MIRPSCYLWGAQPILQGILHLFDFWGSSPQENRQVIQTFPWQAPLRANEQASQRENSPHFGGPTPIVTHTQLLHTTLPPVVVWVLQNLLEPCNTAWSPQFGQYPQTTQEADGVCKLHAHVSFVPPPPTHPPQNKEDALKCSSFGIYNHTEHGAHFPKSRHTHRPISRPSASAPRTCASRAAAAGRRWRAAHGAPAPRPAAPAAPAADGAR